MIRKAFQHISLPTSSVNELPAGVIKKTATYLKKQAQFNLFPITSFYKNETEFFIQSESISKNAFINKHVDFVQLTKNYYRDISSMDKKMLYMRTWFRFEEEDKILKFLNLIETINNPFLCPSTNHYVSQHFILPPFVDFDAFLKKISE